MRCSYSFFLRLSCYTVALLWTCSGACGNSEGVQCSKVKREKGYAIPWPWQKIRGSNLCSCGAGQGCWGERERGRKAKTERKDTARQKTLKKQTRFWRNKQDSEETNKSEQTNKTLNKSLSEKDTAHPTEFNMTPSFFSLWGALWQKLDLLVWLWGALHRVGQVLCAEEPY